MFCTNGDHAWNFYINMYDPLPVQMFFIFELVLCIVQICKWVCKIFPKSVNPLWRTGIQKERLHRPFWKINTYIFQLFETISENWKLFRNIHMVKISNESVHVFSLFRVQRLTDRHEVPQDLIWTIKKLELLNMYIAYIPRKLGANWR